MDRDESRLEVLEHVLDAFNRHDLDAIMSRFADDCVLETPRGREPWGTRFVGKDEVRLEDPRSLRAEELLHRDEFAAVRGS